MVDDPINGQRYVEVQNLFCFSSRVCVHFFLFPSCSLTASVEWRFFCLSGHSSRREHGSLQSVFNVLERAGYTMVGAAGAKDLVFVVSFFFFSACLILLRLSGCLRASSLFVILLCDPASWHCTAFLNSLLFIVPQGGLSP